MTNGETEQPTSLRLPLLVGALILALAALFAFLVSSIDPAPPRRVVMSTGPEDGAYHAVAKRYQTVLAQYGIDLELLPSAGAIENLERLRSRTGGTTVALVQGGLSSAAQTPGVVTLGSVYYEPMWLFYYTGRDISFITDLVGKRIAVGRPGSGTAVVTRQLLATAGVVESGATMLPIGGLEAANALISGELDAAIFVAPPEAPAVRKLLTAANVRLFSIRRADAYVRTLPFLHKVILPGGFVDLVRDIPPGDVVLLSPLANLVATENIHPVIVDLLLEAAKQVHGGAGAFQSAGQFPAPLDLEFPLSPDAERFYRGSGESQSFLRRNLPFWAAVWIQRLLFFAIPLTAILFPLFHYLPALYNWQMRRRIYRWYGELKAVESAVRDGQGDAGEQMKRLDAMEARVDALKVPLSFSSELYNLRSHVALVRTLLADRAK